MDAAHIPRSGSGRESSGRDRNMQNFSCSGAWASLRKPILLKRAAWPIRFRSSLMSAIHLGRGNEQ
jgi:hypothetical protein